MACDVSFTPLGYFCGHRDCTCSYPGRGIYSLRPVTVDNESHPHEFEVRIYAMGVQYPEGLALEPIA